MIATTSPARVAGGDAVGVETPDGAMTVPLVLSRTRNFRKRLASTWRRAGNQIERPDTERTFGPGGDAPLVLARLPWAMLSRACMKIVTVVFHQPADLSKCALTWA